MNSLLLLLSLSIATIDCLSINEQWINFKSKFNKTYKSSEEEQYRYRIFQSNVERIEAHNEKYAAGLSTYYMGINGFADITFAEFKEKNKMKVPSKKVRRTESGVRRNFTAPSSIDWREQGAVLEVRDQQRCGCCWAVATIGAIEGQNAIVNGDQTLLSLQQFVDCDRDGENDGCNGGWITDAFEWAESNGVLSEDDYPYEGTEGSCRDSYGSPVVRLTGYHEVDDDEDSLQEAVGTAGPVAVIIDCSQDFMYYEGGIFSDPNCIDNGSGNNHGVLVVGYDSDEYDYWIVKNSWGDDWGENGYIRMIKGYNLCGMAWRASYPTVD